MTKPSIPCSLSAGVQDEEVVIFCTTPNCLHGLNIKEARKLAKELLIAAEALEESS